MKWHFKDGEYAMSEGILKKVKTGSEAGAVGERTFWSGFQSDGVEDFIFVMKRQTGVIEFGVAEGEQKTGRKAFGIGLEPSGQVVVRSFANALTMADPCCRGVKRRGRGAIAEVRVSIRRRRLRMSWHGGALQDLDFDLPEAFVPWVNIFNFGDEIELLHVQSRRVPLQISPRMDAGSVMFLCNTLGGEEVGAIGGLRPEDLGSVLTARVREEVPAPRHAGWTGVLPSGVLLEKEQLTMPLQKLFELHQIESQDAGERQSEDDSLQVGSDFDEASRSL